VTQASLHVLHVFSTFVPAGPETRACRLIEAFDGEFRHSILAMDGRTDARALLPDTAEVRFLESPPKAGSIATVRRFRDLLKAENPDLLLTYNWGAFDAVMAARTLKLRRSSTTRTASTRRGPRAEAAPRFARRLVLRASTA
jgi:hypothetical protein